MRTSDERRQQMRRRDSFSPPSANLRGRLQFTFPTPTVAHDAIPRRRRLAEIDDLLRPFRIEVVGANPRHAASQANSICLMARGPLQPAMTYTVSVQARVDNRPWRRSWKFTTIDLAVCEEGIGHARETMNEVIAGYVSNKKPR